MKGTTNSVTDLHFAFLFYFRVYLFSTNLKKTVPLQRDNELTNYVAQCYVNSRYSNSFWLCSSHSGTFAAITYVWIVIPCCSIFFLKLDFFFKLEQKCNKLALFSPNSLFTNTICRDTKSILQTLRINQISAFIHFSAFYLQSY